MLSFKGQLLVFITLSIFSVFSQYFLNFHTMQDGLSIGAGPPSLEHAYLQHILQIQLQQLGLTVLQESQSHFEDDLLTLGRDKEVHWSFKEGIT